jgi:hypothetical protein
MTKLAALVTIATLAACLVLPSRADAYFLTCSQAVNAILYGNQGQQGVAVGHAAGAVDVLAGLVCLTGGRTCSCLANVIAAQTDAFSNALASQLTSCVAFNPNDPAFGAAMRAARQICG